MAPDEEGTLAMASLGDKTVRDIAKEAIGWYGLVIQAHDQAGLDEYDHDLIELILDEVVAAAQDEVWRIYMDDEKLSEIVERYREKKNAAAATAARA